MGQAEEDNHDNETGTISLDEFASRISLDPLQVNENDGQSEDHWKPLSPDQLRQIESNAGTNKNSSTSQMSGILANREGIITVTFGYAKGHKAGLPVANREDQSLKLPAKKENSYAPFRDKHDYSMAK